MLLRFLIQGKRAVYLVFILTNIILAARNLDSKPFWIDESIAVMPAKNLLPYQTFDTNFMPWQIKHNLWDPATPLYRVTLSVFVRIFGFSENSTRAFSLCFAVLTLCVVFALLYRLRGFDFALRASALVAVLPAFIGISSEARHYSFTMFWIFFSAYAFLRFVQSQSPGTFSFLMLILVGAMLSHVMAYLIAPIIVVFLIMNNVRLRAFLFRFWPLTILCMFLAYLSIFLDTLPFMHIVNCSNRNFGCERGGDYYLGTVWKVLEGLRIQYETFVPPNTNAFSFMGIFGLAAKELTVAHLAMLSGVLYLIRYFRQGNLFWKQEGLLLGLLLFPLAILSVREYKAHKYFLIYAMPVIGYVMANGFDLFGNRHAYWRHISEIFFFFLIAASLHLNLSEAIIYPRAYFSDMEKKILVKRQDNFERMDAQVRYFRENASPKDAIVATMDDASLSHYLGRFVFSFLNNRHDDRFFLNMLAEAEKNNSRVFFINMIESNNHCLTNEPEPRSVDCRKKYPAFFSRCTSGTDKICIEVKPQDLP